MYVGHVTGTSNWNQGINLFGPITSFWHRAKLDLIRISRHPRCLSGSCYQIHADLSEKKCDDGWMYRLTDGKMDRRHSCISLILQMQ